MFAAAVPDVQVLDWNHRLVGRLEAADLNPRTLDVRALVVDPTLETRRRLGGPGRLRIPVRWVVGLRRGEVVLECEVDDLSRFEARASGGVPCEAPFS